MVVEEAHNEDELDRAFHIDPDKFLGRVSLHDLSFDLWHKKMEKEEADKDKAADKAASKLKVKDSKKLKPTPFKKASSTEE